jgi:hypothetical protein
MFKERVMDSSDQEKGADSPEQMSKLNSPKDKGLFKEFKLRFRRSKTSNKYLSKHPFTSARYLSDHHKLLTDDQFNWVEYPVKKLTVAFCLVLVATVLCYVDVWFLSEIRYITKFYSTFLVLLTGIILLLCSVDSLHIDTKTNTFQFRRKGLIHSEKKSFGLNQLKHLRIVRSVKKYKCATIKSYTLQAFLISNVYADLFRSFEKRKIKELVDLK